MTVVIEFFVQESLEKVAVALVDNPKHVSAIKRHT
jgi:hypothetical protein